MPGRLSLVGGGIRTRTSHALAPAMKRNDDNYTSVKAILATLLDGILIFSKR
jgi:hypothetical protein